MASIAEEFTRKQKEFEWDYEFRLVGASAFAASFDSWSSNEFIETIRNECQPNGYIYGVGCDTITSLLKLFKESPLGMILVDIDPAVVAYTKIFVHCLARFETAREFFLECCGKKNKAFYECLEEMVMTLESSSVVREQMLSQKQRVKMEWSKNFIYCHEGDYAPYWMKEGYQRLHQLAKEGNIAVLHADLFDQRVINFLSELPKWKESKNLVYMANASDHIHRNVMSHYSKDEFVEGLNKKIISRLENLKGKNYFIDTTQLIGYKLRLKTETPYFSANDFY